MASIENLIAETRKAQQEKRNIPYALDNPSGVVGITWELSAHFLLDNNSFRENIVNPLFGKPIDEITTEKGYWKIFERYGYKTEKLIGQKKEPKDEFLAVYHHKGKAYFRDWTCILGDMKFKGAMNETLDIVTSKMLEQKKVLSWPPGIFTESNDLNILKYIMFAEFTGCLVSIAMIGIGAGFAAPLYKTKHYILGTVAATGPFLGLAAGAAVNLLRRPADMIRTGYLSKDALNLKYGCEGVLDLLEEKYDADKLNAYHKVIADGFSVSKEDFETAFDKMVLFPRLPELFQKRHEIEIRSYAWEMRQLKTVLEEFPLSLQNQDTIDTISKAIPRYENPRVMYVKPLF
jgi:hypothetical protein